MTKQFASLLISFANGLSLFRLCSVPGIVFLIWQSAEVDSSRWAAFWLVACLQACDMLDGYIARKGSRHLATRNYFGEIIDPIADKMYIGAAFVSLGLTDQCAAWVVILVIARDVGIIAGWSFVYKRFGVRLLPNALGKVTDGALALLLGVVLLRLDPTVVASLTQLVAALALASGYAYTRMATRAISVASFRRLRLAAATRRRGRHRAAKGGVGTAS